MPAANIPSPIDAPAVWETLIITDGATVRNEVLGVANVDVRGLGLKEQERDVPGKDGVTRTFLGFKDAEASIKINAITTPEFQQLRQILERFRGKRGQVPVAYTFVHPNLQLHGITYMYIFDIAASDYDPDTGYTLELQCREWQSETKVSKSSGKIKGKKDKDDVEKGNPPPSSTNKPQKPQSNAQNARNDRPAQRNTSSLAKSFAVGSNAARGILGGGR